MPLLAHLYNLLVDISGPIIRPQTFQSLFPLILVKRIEIAQIGGHLALVLYKVRHRISRVIESSTNVRTYRATTLRDLLHRSHHTRVNMFQHT